MRVLRSGLGCVPLFDLKIGKGSAAGCRTSADRTEGVCVGARGRDPLPVDTHGIAGRTREERAFVSRTAYRFIHCSLLKKATLKTGFIGGLIGSLALLGKIPKAPFVGAWQSAIGGG
jgi:hypothetical protein